jgi:hypothetical protein
MLTIISYIAGGGGNHLKNILSLDTSFANSDDLNLSAYDGTQEPYGTVHSILGRNVGPHKIDRVTKETDKQWLLHGHWGELMPYRSQISWPDNQWLLLTLDTQEDRDLITTRHQRLSQHPHPYWLNEEQLYLYRPEMYQTYFSAVPEKIFQLSVVEFWHPDLNHNKVIQRINDFFKINIDPVKAQEMHNKWWEMNFYFKWDYQVRHFYNMA